MSNVVPFHGGIKPRSAPPRADERVEHAPWCTWRSGGWMALGTCNCGLGDTMPRMSRVDPREAKFETTPTRRILLTSARWLLILTVISLIVSHAIGR